MPKRQGFCILCKKFQEVKKFKKYYQCLVCGTKHSVKVYAGEPKIIASVKLTNKGVFTKEAAIILETHDIQVEGGKWIKNRSKK